MLEQPDEHAVAEEHRDDGEVEVRVAEADVAPVDQAAEPAAGDEHVRGLDIGVQHGNAAIGGRVIAFVPAEGVGETRRIRRAEHALDGARQRALGLVVGALQQLRLDAGADGVRDRERMQSAQQRRDAGQNLLLRLRVQRREPLGGERFAGQPAVRGEQEVAAAPA